MRSRTYQRGCYSSEFRSLRWKTIELDSLWMCENHKNSCFQSRCVQEKSDSPSKWSKNSWKAKTSENDEAQETRNVADFRLVKQKNFLVSIILINFHFSGATHVTVDKDNSIEQFSAIEPLQITKDVIFVRRQTLIVNVKWQKSASVNGLLVKNTFTFC